MEPFIGSAAVRRGELTRRGLARAHRPIYRDVYLARDVELTARLRARAAWLATGAVLGGLSAAAVFGTKWLDPAAPAEIIRPDRHSQTGIVAHSWQLVPGDVCSRRGMLMTTPARTAFDIGRLRPCDAAVPVLDALIRATGLDLAEVVDLAGARRRVRGVDKLRAVLDLCDGGAESPKESQVRLLLRAAGLPRPETQIEFYDAYGQPFIRVDMGWRTWKVAVEYDGVQHWENARQREWDIERIALLEAMGWIVIRVSAPMLRRPQVFIERARVALRARGCPI